MLYTTGEYELGTNSGASGFSLLGIVIVAEDVRRLAWLTGRFKERRFYKDRFEMVKSMFAGRVDMAVAHM
jgi:hypothetical protein